MIEKYWVDHLYKYIEIEDKTLEFINHPPIQKAFLRLSKISQLGLTSKIFPSATHTKFDHNLGVYFLADYLLNKSNLSSDVIKPFSFKIASVIHGIGHFPFSLSTEIALQKASFFDKNAEDFINSKIKPIVDRILKGSDPKEKKMLIKQILKDRGRINHFYRFFTTNILLENEQELRKGFKHFTDFDFDELLRYLCLPQHVGFRLLNHIDRLDFILRDMFHMGIIKIDINLPFYFENLEVIKDGSIKLPSEWDVLNELESYAIEKIYNEQRVKTAEALYQKIFTKAIIDSEIDFADLLEWGDNDIERKIKEYQKKKNQKYKIFEQINRIKSKFNSLPTYNFFESNRKSNTKNLLLFEGKCKSIGKGKNLQRDIDKSINNGVFKVAYPSSFDNTSDIYVNLVCLDMMEIKYFFTEIAKYENYFKKIDKLKIAQCIWGNNFKKIDVIKYIHIGRAFIQKMKQDKGFNTEQFLIKFIAQHIPEGVISKEFPQMMFNLLPGFKESADEVISSLLLKEPEEILLDKEFISLSDFQNIQEFLDFAREFSNKRLRRIKNFRGMALEYYNYLKKVCELPKREDQIKKWIFISTLIDKGEIDVWSLYVFKNRKPLIELIECSLTENETKKLKAISKLKQKQNFLEKRFKKKIEIKMFFNDEEIRNN